jgi:hypothetical protein
MSVTKKKVSNLVGYESGRLKVVEYLGLGKHKKHYWKCQCDCGNSVVLPTYRITGSKSTRSCGCLRKESLEYNRNDPTKHGLHKHKLYSVYASMKQRCTNPNSQRWKYYGEKGVCVSWKSFEDFYSWAMYNGYHEGLSIDRIDPDGDYCPDNCRWITLADNTRRSNVRNSRGKVQEGTCHQEEGKSSLL